MMRGEREPVRNAARRRIGVWAVPAASGVGVEGLRRAYANLDRGVAIKPMDSLRVTPDQLPTGVDEIIHYLDRVRAEAYPTSIADGADRDSATPGMGELESARINLIRTATGIILVAAYVCQLAGVFG